MCVLIVKPAGAEVPNEKILSVIGYVNRDGFGFATDKLFYKTIKEGDFLEAIKQVKTADSAIIHLRYATHGSRCKTNAHPFYQDGVYFAHNGVLSVKPRPNRTDSETVFKDLFSPIIASYGLESKELEMAVKTIIGGSKFAFMDKSTGKIKTFGNFQPFNGCMYSNLQFMHFVRNDYGFSTSFENC